MHYFNLFFKGKDEEKCIEIVEKKFEDGVEVAMDEANNVTRENPEIDEKTEIETAEIQEIKKAEDEETEETMETNVAEENTAENPEITIQKKSDEDGEPEIQDEKNNENETAGGEDIHTVS